MLQVLHDHLQQVIHVAGQGMAGDDLVPAVHSFDEAVQALLAVLFQLYADEGLQAQANPLGIDQGRIALDDTRGFQPLDPAQAGRRLQVHLGGDIGLGGAPVLLQE